MRVLVGCEFSGTVRDAFREQGHDAWSCDLLPAEPHSRYHVEQDVYACIEEPGGSWWDLIILHPPCTYLAVSGNRWYAGTPDRGHAITWTLNLWTLACSHAPRVCLENPVGVLTGYLTTKPQYIQPWQFGHGETKKTGLWLHNLPPLEPTDVVEGRDNRIHRMPPSEDRGKLRSITYPGIARAMATQWGSL